MKATGGVHYSRLALFLCMIVLDVCDNPAAAEESQEVLAVRQMIDRSVPFIEGKGAEWIATKDCLSCHHTAFMVWALSAAKQKGIHVDQDKLREYSDWATDWQHMNAQVSRAKANRAETMRGQCDTVAQLLLGRTLRDSQTKQPQWVVDFANDLAKAQQDDGSWSSGGQLPSQKRPKRETQEVSTMWTLLALNASNVRIDSLPSSVQKARTWLGEKTAGDSTEWWATRTILERTLGSREKADYFRDELLKRQRPDGGWGWLCNEDSDALGTGIALFALSEDKLPASHPAIANARQFLVRTQLGDGSWPVRGTKQNAKDRVVETATFWGTCWSVIGLCATLDSSP